MEPRYLDMASAAHYLSIKSAEALYKLVRRRKVPYTRLGRSIRFDVKALDSWMERRAVVPPYKKGTTNEQPTASA